MKFTFIFLFILFISPTVAESDNVFLRNGTVYRNVMTDTTGAILLITMDGQVDSVQRTAILMIDRNDHASVKNSSLSKMSDVEKRFFGLLKRNVASPGSTSAGQGDEYTNAALDTNYDRNMRCFTLGVLCAAFTWVELNTASSLTDKISYHQYCCSLH
jgi:hypothetical protein